MPPEVRRIAERYMHDPFELTIGRKNEGSGNIEHFYYIIHERDRYQALRRILDATPEIFGIIFCRTKADAQRVAEDLSRDGYNADSLHGDLTQGQRDKVMARYRGHHLDVLVATDVAARGIDVNDVTHVIHYNLPDEPESYTHRSGRTARAGKSGISMALINTRETDKIRFIEKKMNAKIHLARIPDAIYICEQQLMHLVKKIHHVSVNESGISKYLPSVFEEFSTLSKEELIKRMVSIEFNRFLDAYRSAQDLNVDLVHHGNGGPGYRSSGPRMFINLGSLDGLSENTMRRYVSDITGIAQKEFGRIDVKGVYSFIDIPEAHFQRALNAFDGEYYGERPVRVEISGPGQDKKGGKKGGKKRGWGDKGGKKTQSSRGGWNSSGGKRASEKKKRKW